MLSANAAERECRSVVKAGDMQALVIVPQKNAPVLPALLNNCNPSAVFNHNRMLIIGFFSLTNKTISISIAVYMPCER